MGGAHDQEFLGFVEARSASLTRLAFVLTGGDGHLADDLVQETLLSAYRQWHRVKDAKSADAYVRRMLVNQLFTWRRRASFAELPHAIVPEVVTQDPTGDAEPGDLWPVITRLPARQRAVLVLRYYEDLDDSEIAELLGYRVGSVRVIAARALGELRQVVERERVGRQP